MSKGLEALEELKKQPIYDTRHFYNIVLFKTIERELKALKIIKEHWTFNDIGLVQIKPISMEDANLLKGAIK